MEVNLSLSFVKEGEKKFKKSGLKFNPADDFWKCRPFAIH